MNNQEELLIEAIQDDDLKKVQKLLQAGVNPNALDENDKPCIRFAINNKNLDIVNALLDYGADPNTIDKNRDPIILDAIRSRELDIINTLLEKGANPNVLDRNENPVLLLALIRDVDTVDALLNNGADPNQVDKNGNTALSIILERTGDIQIDTTSLLIEKDREKALNLRNSNGETFLHLAAQQGKIQIFDKYLDYYQTVNITDKAGNTPLYWSKLFGHTKISEILTKRAEELNETAYTKITKTERFEDLPPRPKIALSYNSEIGGPNANEAKKKLIYQGGDLEYIDFREIVPESANKEQKIDEEVINEAKQKAKELLADKDALVIPGNDKAVDPKVAEQFGGLVELKDSRSDFARSLAEMVMAEVAIERGMPIMGICGGHQIINTYLKGKIGDMPDHKHDSITIEPTSELASIIKMNSLLKEIPKQNFWASHSNMVQEIGGKDRLIDKKELLKVSATTKHGEIEATESQFGAPIRTFQFHPEKFDSEPKYSIKEVVRDKKIFASFVQSAQTFANKKKLGVNIESKVPKQKNFRAMISEQRKERPTGKGR
ncbi:MAG: hypothetical protein RLZZ81_495 [Pseudomonadota bacterium]|jgi:ankyrin repeat protein/gamma-glutamyl-gamma-aminobutyrate hydrolase PuuD